MLNQLSLLTIALTGAAMLREREHGTIEHLMVMPLTPAEVALSKVLATMIVVLVAFIGSLLLVVQGLLQVPVAGSVPLLVAGAAVYLWAAAAIGMLLGTVARSMAQFALLVIVVIIPVIMLSGGMGAVESQPDLVQKPDTGAALAPLPRLRQGGGVSWRGHRRGLAPVGADGRPGGSLLHGEPAAVPTFHERDRIGGWARLAGQSKKWRGTGWIGVPSHSPEVSF